ncbi:hypothetical protein GGI15_003210 [Coemansia interrupta]|uniref:Uncharacterized protein n=1 Tax=Coemansia interrupta TaxID=1126814 RepID=A0A9W8HFH8_9FUNG|nr:hypothetical protein GGI15_003210 [Coemansia interrupta]
MSSDNIASIYKANEQTFTASSPADNIPKLFGPPTLMGSTLDSLQSTSAPGFAAQMPGIVLGEPSKTPAAASSAAEGEVHIQQVQEEQQPNYYIAYDDKDKILWFHVQVTPDGEESLLEHGWKDKD